MVAVIDHLVVAAATLAAATAHGTGVLGAQAAPGGRHAVMGTHNRLWSLGPDDYLEALAPDPEARAPCRPRWFGLDDLAGPPRLVGWALRVDDLDAACARAPDDIGPAVAMWRGDFRWKITVPDSGRQPFNGLFPALISWTGEAPPAALPETEARLLALTISHPEAGKLGWALSMLTDDDRVIVRKGPVGLRALIHTEAGERELA